jgi:hypothetical protein
MESAGKELYRNAERICTDSRTNAVLDLSTTPRIGTHASCTVVSRPRRTVMRRVKLALIPIAVAAADLLGPAAANGYFRGK